MFDIKISNIYEKISNKTMDIINVNCIVQIGEDVFYVLAIFFKTKDQKAYAPLLFCSREVHFSFLCDGWGGVHLRFAVANNQNQFTPSTENKKYISHGELSCQKSNSFNPNPPPMKIQHLMESLVVSSHTNLTPEHWGTSFVLKNVYPCPTSKGQSKLDLFSIFWFGLKNVHLWHDGLVIWIRQLVEGTLKYFSTPGPYYM